jgi:hypothetical protein
MPYAGPYVQPYNPWQPVPTIWPNQPYVQPWQPYPGDVYVGDPPPGQGSISICSTTVSMMN